MGIYVYICRVLAFLELVYGSKQQAEELGTSLMEQIHKNLEFAFKCHGTKKSVLRSKTEIIDPKSR